MSTTSFDPDARPVPGSPSAVPEDWRDQIHT